MFSHETKAGRKVQINYNVESEVRLKQSAATSQCKCMERAVVGREVISDPATAKQSVSVGGTTTSKSLPVPKSPTSKQNNSKVTNNFNSTINQVKEIAAPCVAQGDKADAMPTVNDLLNQNQSPINQLKETAAPSIAQGDRVDTAPTLMIC